MVMVGGFIELM